MDDDQQQRYWFPYWTSPPPPPPPPLPPVRPQLSPPVAPSPSRRPSRAAPLAPVGNNQLPRHPSPIAPPAAHDSAAPKQQDRDVKIITQDKTVREPPAAEFRPRGKAKDHKTPKDKDHKTPKDKDGEEEAFEESAKTKSNGGEQGKPQKAGAGAGHERVGGTSVITLSGENKGASMKVGATNKDKERHGHRLDHGGKEEGGKGMTALINSNVQVINNSLLLQSSCSDGDPGVHLKLSAKSNSKDKQQQRASDGGGKATAASATRSAAKK